MECDPLCDLLWLREEGTIEADDEMFEIIEEVLPEDPDNNVFVSVRSTIIKRANMTFDPETTNFTISCQVSGHQFGDSISSACQWWWNVSVFFIFPGWQITICYVQTPPRTSS